MHIHVYIYIYICIYIIDLPPNLRNIFQRAPKGQQTLPITISLPTGTKIFKWLSTYISSRSAKNTKHSSNSNDDYCISLSLSLYIYIYIIHLPPNLHSIF